MATTQTLVNGPRTAQAGRGSGDCHRTGGSCRIDVRPGLDGDGNGCGASGHPDDANQETVTAGSAPPPPMTLIETVQGPKRQTMAFPEKSGVIRGRAGGVPERRARGATAIVLQAASPAA